MHLMYERAQCNANEARHLYAGQFSNTRLPNSKTLQRIHEHLLETGSFKKHVADTGRQRSTRTPNTEERVLNHIEDNSRSSTRELATIVNVSEMTVWRILREQLFYPY